MNLKDIIERLRALKEEIEINNLDKNDIAELVDDLRMELEDESPFTAFDDDDSLDNFSMSDISH